VRSILLTGRSRLARARGRKTKSKRKTLPKDFEELLKTGDLAKLQAVFDACDVDARGGYAKQTALAFHQCPDTLARWLVAQGADLSAADTWGNTPLHRRAADWHGDIAVLLELGADVHAAGRSIGTPLHAAADPKHAEHARLLIAAGANVDAKDDEGLMPLEVALRGCGNTDLEYMPALVRVLLEAGAARTPAMKKMVEQNSPEIGPCPGCGMSGAEAADFLGIAGATLSPGRRRATRTRPRPCFTRK
jgi:ankyrin repeat protein